jgi:hypothetical protein
MILGLQPPNSLLILLKALEFPLVAPRAIAGPWPRRPRWLERLELALGTGRLFLLGLKGRQVLRQTEHLRIAVVAFIQVFLGFSSRGLFLLVWLFAGGLQDLQERGFVNCCFLRVLRAITVGFLLALVFFGLVWRLLLKCG